MAKNSFIKNILFLDKIYVPKIVSVLYILSFFGTIACGLLLCFYEVPDISVSYNGDFSLETKTYAAEGIALIILGPVFARLYAEALLILFKVHDTISQIADMDEKTENNQGI